MTVTVQAVLKAALVEIGVADPIMSLNANVQDRALGVLNLLLDAWNAERQAVYVNEFNSYTLTVSLNPHTIGPSGATFTATTNRPESVDAANIVLDTNVRIPLAIRDAAWWADQRVPAVETSVPRDLYYQPTWPNGSLYLWPVPDTAYTLHLMTRVVLAQVGINDSINLPPGYQAAITYTLAEWLAPGHRVDLKPGTVQQARHARSVVFGANHETPALATADYGLGAGGAGFNWLTGELR